MIKRVLSILMMFSLLISVPLAQETIVFGDSETEGSDRNAYYIELLQLALDKTVDTYGEFNLERFGGDAVQSRIMREIRLGRIHVFWTMTSAERESELRAIRVPLVKGLLGHRIFIIRKGEQAIFDEVETLGDLKKLRAGQGLDWPDTAILRAGGLNVNTSPQYKYLFKMLEGNRFDYFPRGVTEPWREVENYGDGNFTVEKKLLVQYPAPIFLFVSKDNPKLAERIEQGLHIAIEDGSFDRLFYTHKNNREIFELTDIPSRKIFRIDNPLLTSETELILDEEKYWYKVGEEKKYK